MKEWNWPTAMSSCANSSEQQRRFEADLSRAAASRPACACRGRATAGSTCAWPASLRWRCNGIRSGCDACAGCHEHRCQCWRSRGNAPEVALLGAGDVFARAGVDAQHFAFIDEQRHTHHGAGLQLRRLLPAGCRIATYSLDRFPPPSDRCAAAASPPAGTLFHSVTMQVMHPSSTVRHRQERRRPRCTVRSCPAP